MPEVLNRISHCFLESHRLAALKQSFLLLEDSPLSLSCLEAELHARLVVAESNLELEIGAYNALRSKYLGVISRSEGVAK